MKKTFYSCIASSRCLIILFIAAMLVYGTTAKAQTYTITFQDTPPPTNDPLVDQNDAVLNAIETGVRFHVTQPGTITGIRFYKGNGVAGTHIGHLWTNTGTQLASATFTETANNWQEVAVSVHIGPGVIFVASVFSSLGDYAAEAPGSFNWFASGTPGVDFGTNPIRVPHTVNTINDPAGNGVFDYLSNPTTGAFPTTVNSNNFWIDVRFQPDFSLPVSISDFKATTANNDVLVSWKTSSETNNRGFEIQRSNNGTDWYGVNFVNGAGESTITKNYNYTDKGLAPGLYYYRLRQVDLDGKSKNSGVVTATISGKGVVTLFQNTPNPFSGSSTIRFDLPRAQKVRLSIIDVAGREIKVLTDNMSEAGSHQVTLDAATLRRQLYLVRLQTEDGVLTKNILVQ